MCAMSHYPCLLFICTIPLPLPSFGTQINDDTLTLRVKCSNGISVRLLGWVRRPHFYNDRSVIVLIIPREWHPLGAVARICSVPSFLVIVLRTANKRHGVVAKD